MRPAIILILACCIAVAGCRSNRLARSIESQPLYNSAFSGFHVADAATGEVLYQQNASKLFTPASNTKLLTLATALAWLPQDSLPALAYRFSADTLRLWALAYPNLAADASAYNNRIRDLIANHDGPVEIGLHGYWSLPRFGEGWMWDDYPYAFARERSGLPMYRNLVQAWVPQPLEAESELASRPDFLVTRTSDYVKGDGLERGENEGRYYASAKTRQGDTLYAPLYGVSSMANQLLEDWTGRIVRYHNERLPADWGQRVWLGEHRDTLLRDMMLPSDNFLAEHLLLHAGLYHDNLTNPTQLRDRAQRKVLAIADEDLAWADASGISHYNLVTPLALSGVMVSLYNALGPDGIKSLFPAGGVSGTIENWYEGPEGKPYVWAKTGTLRHNHALTGLLRAKSGRYLVFSMMHNHYRGSSAVYKAAMQETLLDIYQAY